MNDYLTPPLNMLRLVFRSSFSQKKWFFVSILLWLTPALLLAQLQVKADRNDARYQIGETAGFDIQSHASGTVTYEIKYDNNTPSLQSGSINLTAGVAQRISYQGSKAEAVVCIVKQGGQTSRAAAVFSPFRIAELESEPSDYDAFWNNQKAQLSGIPLDAQLSLFNEQANSRTYTLSMSSVDGRRVYGYVSVPKSAGPFPAVITLPPFGASAGIAQPEAFVSENANVISVSLSIHNTPPNQTDPNAYTPDDITNRERVYYRYGVLAALRGIEYLHTRSDFNGELAMTGVSQGAGLSVIAAGLDNRVDLLLLSNAALSQHAGLKYDRASGFPYYLNKGRAGNFGDDVVLQAVKYYDAVYAAKRFKGQSLTIVS
ncbi:MAG: acetylxylan esterase, partial [Bacteroidota bacterium]